VRLNLGAGTERDGNGVIYVTMGRRSWTGGARRTWEAVHCLAMPGRCSKVLEYVARKLGERCFSQETVMVL
jgi:hypothetical protein